MYRIGIDLGGTNIAVGIVDERDNIVSHTSLPTGAGRPAELVVADMCRAVEIALAQAELTVEQCESLGVGSPGACDGKQGVVLRSYSLNWHNVPLAQMLNNYFHIPVRVENDANCAALAETRIGAAAGRKNVVMVTLGTGVGSGIILDGKIYSGLNGAGAEMGHMMLCYGGELCSCGRRGCWDAYASATALIRQAGRAAQSCPQSKLNRIPKITGLAVFETADEGDAAAQQVIDRYCQYIAVGLTDIINALAPEMILIGGGISRQGERLIAPIREQVATACFDKRRAAIPEILPARLGNEAGIIGAAAL